MAMDCHTLVCDHAKLSRFKIIVMPRVCQSHWNLMKWADLKIIYTTKATLGFKRNPKEFAWATNIKCTLLSQLSLGIFHELLVKWVFFSNMQVWTLGVLFYIYLFQQSQAWVGSIPESKLKSTISHSSIHMDFIGLVTWSGVRRLWKKRSERPKECLRVILSKNLKSVACTFIHVNFWFGLYSFCLIH